MFGHKCKLSFVLALISDDIVKNIKKKKKNHVFDKVWRHDDFLMKLLTNQTFLRKHNPPNVAIVSERGGEKEVNVKNVGEGAAA